MAPLFFPSFEYMLSLFFFFAEEEKFEFGVLNPVMMLGPILHNTKCTSIELIKRLLERNPMFLPKMNLPMIDVRDAAAAHVKALKIKEVNGR